jgi:hypothetical protein
MPKRITKKNKLSEIQKAEDKIQGLYKSFKEKGKEEKKNG